MTHTERVAWKERVAELEKRLDVQLAGNTISSESVENLVTAIAMARLMLENRA